MNVSGDNITLQINKLKNLQDYLTYHKYSLALQVTIIYDVKSTSLSFCVLQEIDRLTNEKVELPIQEILSKFLKNSEYEKINELYEILLNSQISLSDISYIYLIDANIKSKNILNALNVCTQVLNLFELFIFISLSSLGISLKCCS